MSALQQGNFCSFGVVNLDRQPVVKIIRQRGVNLVRQEVIFYASFSTIINPCDIPQFSSLNNSTINLCKGMVVRNDPGMSFVEIGKFLLDDGILRSVGAYRKYGENQVKTSYDMGLTQVKENVWYLSCIGHVFLSFDALTQREIIARCVLRNRFISKLITDAIESDINIASYMRCLSNSTILRRRSNILTIINICKSQIPLESNISIKKVFCEI